MDAPDLAPAARKRIRSEPSAPSEPAAPLPVAADDLAARVQAIESTVRAIDARVELVERITRDGFQEVASRALVLAEASDEAFARIEVLLSSLPDGGIDTGPLERAMSSLADGLIGPVEAAVAATIDLRTEVASLAERVEDGDAAALRSQIDLVADRLSTLLGGPSLTELMDRIDELERRLRR